jgi:hypothetical protein
LTVDFEIWSKIIESVLSLGKGHRKVWMTDVRELFHFVINDQIPLEVFHRVQKNPFCYSVINRIHLEGRWYCTAISRKLSRLRLRLVCKRFSFIHDIQWNSSNYNYLWGSWNCNCICRSEEFMIHFI